MGTFQRRATPFAYDSSLTCFVQYFIYGFGLLYSCKREIPANVVPGHSTAAISFRIVSDVDLVIEQVHEAIRGLANITTAFGTRNPPQVHYAPPRALATFGSYTAAYNTDLSYFRHAEKKVLFGGGTIANAHVEDEYIDLKDLEAMPNQYEMIVGELLEEQWARGQPANTK